MIIKAEIEVDDEFDAQSFEDNLYMMMLEMDGFVSVTYDEVSVDDGK